MKLCHAFFLFWFVVSFFPRDGGSQIPGKQFGIFWQRMVVRELAVLTNVPFITLQRISHFRFGDQSFFLQGDKTCPACGRRVKRKQLTQLIFPTGKDFKK